MANLSGEARVAPDTGGSSVEEIAPDLTDAGITGAGYVFNSPEDQRDIKTQRQAIWDLVKNLGSHLLREGVNLTKISLPVRVFEPRSFLQRLTDNWAYIPLLEQAAAAADPADRMRLVVAFVIGGLRRQTSTLKPFNPILGETYEGIYETGALVYAEQISHHPPISSWQVIDPKGQYRFYGCGNWKASARGNSIKGQQAGSNSILFAKDNAVISWELPPLLLRGILWGERSLKYSGAIRFRDDHNNLMCEISLDVQQSGFMSMLWRSRKAAKKGDQLQGTLRKGNTTLDTVHGSWLTGVEWEAASVAPDASRRLWDAAKSKVHAPTPVEEPLPSDARFREDLRALQAGDLDLAQEWKSRLEQRQRAEQALRIAGKSGTAH